MSPSHQKDIILFYTQTSKDEVPQVRVCSAKVLNEMIALDAGIPKEDLLNIFMNFYEDEHVNVRMQGVQNCLSFAKKGVPMTDYL